MKACQTEKLLEFCVQATMKWTGLGGWRREQRESQENLEILAGVRKKAPVKFWVENIEE